MSNDLIDDHLTALRAAGRPETTIEARGDVLRRLSRRLEHGLIFAARDQIEGWLSDLRVRGRARATISIYAYHTREFFDWACSMGLLDGNPTGGMEKPKMPVGVPHPVSEDELAIMLGLAEPLLTAVILAAFEGMRRSEIAQCRREHITADLVHIPIRKGGNGGTVPTHPFVWEHLRDRSPGLLVTNSAGGEVTGHWLSVRARYGFDAVGLGDVHLHRLRDRYGTVLQERYRDLRVTQECLGHASVTSTQKYTLVTGQRRAEAVATLPVPGR